MKILITGGCGFIGSNFIRYLLRQHPDWHIVNLDKLTYAGNLKNLEDVARDPRYKFIRGDIADRELVDRVFAQEKPDAVVNFAVESHVDHLRHPRGAAHDFRYALDCRKIKEELGWAPKVRFEDGLRRTVEWYLENQDWVEGVITGEYREYYRKVYGTG